MTKEALKTALEALERSLPRLAPYGEQDWLDSKAAITAIKEALAQPKQEPVAALLLQSKQNFERNFGPCWQADWIYSDLSELMEKNT